jgi:DNA-binding TFAR19-related protein (PDSD5 family)
MQQVLDNDARVRLANIAAVKPEKAEQLQNIIISNMQRGGI